jgi:eukaryotic-like serine/threonine-protein kinase
LFAREHKLFARAFDVDRLEFTGDEVPIADDVAYTEVLDTSAFEASTDGTLIFRQQAPQGPDVSAVWVDRRGVTATRADFRLPPTGFRLSADGKKIVYADGDPPDIWVLDVSRGSRTRLTHDANIDHNAVWSPDGAWVAFDSHGEGKRAIYRKRADGAVPEELLYDAGPYEVQVTCWSADGRFIVFQQDSMCIGCNYDVWVLPTFGDRKPIRFTSSQFDVGHAWMSADGGWIAYTTNESGIYQVVVQPFPDQGKWQVSANGGMVPRWARNGRELYFFDATGAIVRVPITIAPAFDVGEPVRVVETSGFRPWDVLADGE